MDKPVWSSHPSPSFSPSMYCQNHHFCVCVCLCVLAVWGWDTNPLVTSTALIQVAIISPWATSQSTKTILFCFSKICSSHFTWKHFPETEVRAWHCLAYSLRQLPSFLSVKSSLPLTAISPSSRWESSEGRTPSCSLPNAQLLPKQHLPLCQRGSPRVLVGSIC